MLDQTYSEEFEVEQIIDEKIIDGETHFLVKWVGYGHQENTWQPMRHMTNSKDKVKLWEKYKLKQLSILQNYKLLEDLDLHTDKNRISNQAYSEFIEAARKSSTPYKNIKPLILLDTKEISQESKDGKNMSLFDRPEVKKIIKRKKIQRKKKDLEIFEQRLKSRPKVWEKYIQNEEEVIKLANQKIKEVVDHVFGSKRDQSQKLTQKKQEVDLQPKKNYPKKKISKVLKIFSESDDDDEIKTTKIRKQEKNLSVNQSLKKSNSKNNDSSSQIDESTNFISKKQQVQNGLKRAEQNKIFPSTLKDESQEKQKKPEVKENTNSLFPKKGLLIQPETIRLDMSTIKRLKYEKSFSFNTKQSSSSNDLESQCGNKNVFQESYSSSSRDSSDNCKKNQKNFIQKHNALKNQTDKQKVEEGNSQRIIQENSQRQILLNTIEVNRNPKSKKKYIKSIIPLSSDSQNQEKEKKKVKNIIQEKLLSRQSEKIKQEQPKRCHSNANQGAQNIDEYQQIQNADVKLEQDIAKNIYKNEVYPKVQAEKFSDGKINLKVENSLNNKASLLPFECSISTIEGESIRDESTDQEFKKNRSQDRLIKVQISSIKADSTENNEQIVINYSSLTNYRSTALPSSDSEQSYHVFTTQNAFHENFLQNRSLSTRASFNTHHTESQRRNLYSEQHYNHGDQRNENHLQNLDESQKIPQHIFSSLSSQELLDKLNFTEAQNESKKQKISNSLSLEYLLEKINSQSSNFPNSEQGKKNETKDILRNKPSVKMNSTNQVKSQGLIGQPLQIQVGKDISNQNQKLSEESSKRVLDFNKIGSENHGKSSKKTSKKNRPLILYSIPINETCNEIKDLSEYHQKFILKNNLPEEEFA